MSRGSDEFFRKWNLPSDPSWEVYKDDVEGVWMTRGDHSLIISVLKYADGKNWLHMSIAHSNFLPSYKMMCDLKEKFIGSNRKALMIFAPEWEHVNIHKNCLHLWCCMDGDVLPDFRIMGAI